MPPRSDDPLQALSRVPLAVVVIGAAQGSRRGCSTATLTYVSMRPAMVATALVPSSNTCALVMATRELSVSVLGLEQAEIAVKAGGSAQGADKFAEFGIAVEEPPAGRRAPAVAGAAAALWCDLEFTREFGDHLLCVCGVRHARRSDGIPLTRFDRGYHELGARLEVPGERPYPL